MEPLNAICCCTCAFTLAGVVALAGETGDFAIDSRTRLSNVGKSGGSVAVAVAVAVGLGSSVAVAVTISVAVAVGVAEHDV
ncbi:hypothetical protein KTT_14020 [Tengunoibacter tsumagoiensis]|uniref:Uncharacterized protein n=1 Tax=Tengunoibacter tsumagoiensis TaxID=2014871 RepID=A0A401ZXI2_9CHLR|nr:hypothetical protein KTT_14020 [Tengunoibacter tsumagoiensis]